ncbi:MULTISPECIES: AraC family transcriptional regulator [Methylosinus]|uniref:AraC family transcriptional regulator n=1 Tax=Methylosinus trichosporium (strain ATCC 35070 / NCIMB 11131 / UNIQEM 75 / OB3b) TaxID=595536 RepID=A0A2D2D1W2_METT3|nr:MULTISPECIES: helix-turn-helix transcriptional regulator [Methylosinus]ATQ68991.1 AraC family transcriptional regulator [Methylosinus trichosporium OB3b]OBS51876.1 AraC family transcriptional regulator [Methylosinus sp. 3S-1]
MRLDVGSVPPAHVDSVPRALVALSFVGNLERWEMSQQHHHEKAQLLYTVRGIINCEVDDGVWIVPPQCAVWIPGGLPHTVFGSSDVECCCIFIDPRAAENLPLECCTIAVSSLLRQLLIRATELPEAYSVEGRDGRLVSVLLDELAASPVEDLRFPVPADPRLKKLAELLLSDPADCATLAEWASRIALSERSLSRMLKDEIGMSFGRWRRQLHVILAIQRLTAGEAVQTIALDLGYESASSFVTMFRKALGKPPGRYLLNRQKRA